jgi:flavodoxin
MSEFEEFKQSLISSGYSEEIAQKIAEGLQKAVKPNNNLEGGTK